MFWSWGFSSDWPSPVKVLGPAVTPVTPVSICTRCVTHLIPLSLTHTFAHLCFWNFTAVSRQLSLMPLHREQESTNCGVALHVNNNCRWNQLLLGISGAGPVMPRLWNAFVAEENTGCAQKRLVWLTFFCSTAHKSLSVLSLPTVKPRAFKINQ